jgi:hypothetical protein
MGDHRNNSSDSRHQIRPKNLHRRQGEGALAAASSGNHFLAVGCQLFLMFFAQLI